MESTILSRSVNAAYGSMRAQDHLRRSLGVAGARVLPTELAVAHARELFSADGELTDPETREHLAELVDGLAAHHHRFVTA